MNYSYTRTSIAALAVFSTLIIAACGETHKSGDVLAKIGSENVTEGDLNSVVNVNPRLKPRMATPAGKQKVLENYVEQELLYQESKRRGLDSAELVKDKIALYNKIIVAQALLDEELDKKVKEYYDTHKDEFERIKIAHILVSTSLPGKKETPPPAKDPKSKDTKKTEKTETKTATRSDEEALKIAAQIKERLSKGDAFATVAKETSDDEKTKNIQGELGYITIRDKKLERLGWLSIAEKAFALKKDEVSEPIKSKDGYHIVKLLEEKTVQPFEEAEAAIKFRLQGNIRNQIIGDLKTKYKVEFTKPQVKSPESQPLELNDTPGAPAPENSSAAPTPTVIPPKP